MHTRMLRATLGLIISAIGFMILGGAAGAQGLNTDFITVPSAGATLAGPSVTLEGGGVCCLPDPGDARIGIWSKDQQGWLQQGGGFASNFVSLPTESEIGPSLPNEPCCPDNSWSFTTNLTSGNYGMWVVAWDASGNKTGQQWRTFSVEGGQPAPVDSCLVTRQGGTARITVQSQSLDADRFVVRRSRNGGPFFWAGRFDANLDGRGEQTFTAGGSQLRAGDNYRFSVESLNTNGRSDRVICGAEDFSYLRDVEVTRGPNNGTCVSFRSDGAKATMAIKRTSDGWWLQDFAPENSFTAYAQAWKPVRTFTEADVIVKSGDQFDLCNGGTDYIPLERGSYFLGIKSFSADGALGEKVWFRFTV